MREALFRGRRIDNGEWVYGTPIYDGNIVYILSGVVEANEEYICIEDWRLVIPETVGQYTGLDDKNGVKIFKGDITELQSGSIKTVCKVVNEAGTFGVTAFNWGIEWESDDFSFEVIGNIHDNPELVEELFD